MSDLPLCEQTTGVCTTVGDGNCFFHAVFGGYTPGGYQAERAQDMRTEWHKFLNQFTSLNDESMPVHLNEQLQVVLETFLREPEKLTSEFSGIKDLAEKTNDKIVKACNDVNELKKAIVANFLEDDEFAEVIYAAITDMHNTRSPGNKKASLTISDLRKEKNKDKLLASITENICLCISRYIPGLDTSEYGDRYNAEVIKDLFIKSELLYQVYLKGIRSQSYFIFTEEIPILAALSNTKIILHVNGNVLFYEPDSRMINPDYVRIDRLWGSKEQETIFHSGEHFSRFIPGQTRGDLPGPSCGEQGSSTDMSSSGNETQKQSSMLKGCSVTKNQKKARPASGVHLLNKDFQENLTGNNCEFFLQSSVISDVGKHVYKWTESNNIIWGIEGCQRLPAQLEKFKKNRDKRLIYILNQNSIHWVTLVAIHDNRKGDIFFYADSFGEGIEKCSVSAIGKCNTGSNGGNKASSVKRMSLDEFLERKGYSKNNIYSVSCKQQHDGHNCGVFALENAKAILNVIDGGNYDHVKVKESLKNFKKDPVSLREGFAKSLKDFAEGFKETLNSASTVAEESKRDGNKPIGYYQLKNSLIIKVHGDDDDALLRFLRTEEGKVMSNFLIKNKYMKGILGIINRSGHNSQKAFEESYNTFFDLKGKKTDKLEHVLNVKFTIDHVFSIMAKSGIRVRKLFNEFHDIVCNERGQPTLELQLILSTGLDICDVKNIMRGTRGKAKEVFWEFYNVFFSPEGRRKPTLECLQKSIMSMKNLVTILGLRGVNSVKLLGNLICELFYSEGEPKPKLKHMLDANCTMENISCILSGSGVKLLEAFNDLHDVWFDEKGEKKTKLQKILDYGFSWKNISSVLNKSGINAPKVFVGFYSVFFDSLGGKSKKLNLMSDYGLTDSHVISMVNKSKLNAFRTVNSFYEVLFCENEEKTKEFDDYLGYGFTLCGIFNVISVASAEISTVFKDFHEALTSIANQKSKISRILERCNGASRVSSLMIGAGKKAPGAFNSLYDALFDNKGEPSSELKYMIESGLSLDFVLSILSGSGANAPEIFIKFHRVLFEAGTKHIVSSDVCLSSIANILHGVGSKAPDAFRDLYGVLFNPNGTKTDKLNHMINGGIYFSSISSILSGSGSKAPDAFRDLYGVLFNPNGTKTDKLVRLLGCRVSFFSIANVLSGSGAGVLGAFNNLYYALFDDEGNITHIQSSIKDSGLSLSEVFNLLTGAKKLAGDELERLHNSLFRNQAKEIKNILNKGIDFANVSSILNGSGAKTTNAFQSLYVVLFKSDGEPTNELSHILGSSIDFSSVSGILSGSGKNAADAFKNLHGVLFKSNGEPTNELSHILGSGIGFSSISSILSKSGAKAADAFKRLHGVLFKSNGEPTNELSHILDSGIDLSSVSSILSGSGAKATDAFQSLYNVLFKLDGEKTNELSHILGSGIGFSSVSSILSGLGTNAADAFKRLHGVLFKSDGEPTNELSHILDSGIDFSSVSSILSGSGKNATCAFKRLHGVLFKSDGEPTDELSRMLGSGVDFASISNMLYRTGEMVKETFDQLYFTFFGSEGKGIDKLSLMLGKGIDFASISNILSRSAKDSPEGFSRLYDALFSLDRSQRCKIDYIVKRKVSFSSISDILSRAGVGAAKAFNSLYNALFDLDHNQRCKLDYISRSRVDFSSISTILRRAGVEAPRAFNSLYNALFTSDGRETDKLANILSRGMTFSSMSCILQGARAKAADAFNKLCDVMLDSSGNQKSRLDCILNSRVTFFSMSNVLSGSGAEAPDAFKNLYDVLFDGSGKEKPELELILNKGIGFASLSNIISRSGAKAPDAFKNLYKIFLDGSEKGRSEVDRILNKGINFANVSSILGGSGAKAPDAFKNLCDVLFDLDHNQQCKLDYILRSRVNFASISGILSGSGAKAPDAFKNLYGVLFKSDGRETDELSHIIDIGIDFASVSNILNQSGAKAADAFENLHGVLFKSDGEPTNELSHILGSSISFTSLSSILSKSGAKAADAFKELHGVLFKPDGGETDQLMRIIDSGISFARLSSVLSGSGAKSAETFKNFYDVLFDSNGNQNYVFDGELNVTHFFNILACSGAKAPEAFKNFYDDFYDNEVDLETDLECMLDKQMDMDDISNILYGAGLNAKSCFKNLRYALFDSSGDEVQDLCDMLNKGIMISDLSNMLSKAETRAPESFKKFHNALFDDKRNPRRELGDIVAKKLSLEAIFNILGREGEVSPDAFRKLHGVLFKPDGEQTDELNRIISSGIDFASLSSILSGSGAKAEKAFKDFHDALFYEEGGKKPNLQRILNEKMNLAGISRVLYGAGVEAKERFNRLCGFWFDSEEEEVNDVYIAFIFNLKVLRNNSVFDIPGNIAQICACLSIWPSEVLKGKNVQSLAGKFIKNVKKISAQFKFQDIAPIYNAIARLYESNQTSTSSSNTNFDSNVCNNCVSDLAACAITLAPVQHNIRYIMNMVFSLSRLARAGLVIDEDLSCELIHSLTKKFVSYRLDSSYSDKNHLHVYPLVNSFSTLVCLIYQSKRRDTIISRELAQGMLETVSNLNSVQKNMESSINMLSTLNKLSELMKNKVEAKFFQRAIGSVLYNLQFINEHQNDDLGEKAPSLVNKLSDKLKKLLCSDLYRDHLTDELREDLTAGFSPNTRVEIHSQCTKEKFLITSRSILIDEDQSEKYTLKQIKEQGEIKYKAGVEDQIQYSWRALGLNYDFNVEKNDSDIILAKVACLEEEMAYGLFLNTKKSISPKAFLGTGNREMNECVLERYSQISPNSEKERNWASYLNHASIGTSNVIGTLNKLRGHACLILSTSREILPGHQLLFNYKQDRSRRLDSIPIYLHYTDNYKSPSQRYNSAKDFYYDYVFSLEREIARVLGYRGQKYFVVTKLFKQIYDKGLSQVDYESDSTTVLSEVSNIPIYAVTLKNGKWNFDKYSKQQQIVPLMLACYFGQEDIIKVLLERDDIDVTYRSLHGGYNALTFTVINRKTDSETKKRILVRLINKINTIGEVYDNKKQAKVFLSEVLCSTDSLCNSLFDHLMREGEYLLYQEFYKKLSQQSKREVARKFISERGMFNVVFSLGGSEYIKIVNLLLKKVSEKMIKECLEGYEERDVDYNEILIGLLSNNRNMRLSNFNKLTSLSEPIKRKILSFLTLEEPLLGRDVTNAGREESSQEVAGPDAAVEEPPLGRDVTNAGREESSQEVAGPDAVGGGRPQKRARLSQEGGAELLVHLVNVEEDVNKYYRVSSKCGGKIFKSLVSQRNAGYVGFDISFVRKTMDAIRSNNSRIIADNKKKLLSCILWDVLRLALTPVLAEVFDLALELHCDVKEILSAFSYHSIRCAIYSEENDCVKFILDKVGQDLDREKMKDAILYATLLAVRGGGLNILLSLLDNVKAEEKMYFFSEIIKTTTYLHGLIYEYEELDSTKVFCHFANIITCDDRETIFKSVNASYEANLELLKKKLVGSPVKDSASIVIEEPSQEVAGPDAAVEEPPLGRDVTNAGREESSQEVAGPDAAVEEPPLGRDVTNAGREESSQEVAGPDAVGGGRPQKRARPDAAGGGRPQKRARPDAAGGGRPQKRAGPDAAGGGRPQKRARLSQEGGAELLVHLVNVEEDVNKYYRVSSKCGGKIFKSLVSQRNAGYVGFDISFVRKTMDAIRSNNSRIIADNKKKLLSCILWDVLRLALTPVLAEVFDLALELHCDVKEILSAFSYHSIRCAIYSEENDCVKFILDKVGQDLDREKMKDAILYATLLAVRGGGLNILLSLLDNVKAEEKMYFFSEIIKTTTYLHGLIYEYEELDSTKVFCHFANIITCDDRETIFKSVNASYEANLELLKKKLVGSPVKDSASIVIEESSQEVAGPDAAVEEPPLGRDVTNAGREESSQEVAGPDAVGGGRPQKRARLSQEGGAELLVHLVNVEEDVNKYYRVSSKCGGKIFKSLVSQRNAGYVGFDISFVRKTMDAIRSNNSRIIADNKKKLLSCILWDVLRLALTPVLAEVFDLALELHCDVKEILSAFSYHSIRCAIYSEENDCVKFILDKVGQDLDREKMKDAILYATLLAVRGGGLNILLSLLDNVKAEEKMYFFSEIIKTTTYLHGLIYEYEELDSTKVFCHFANIITCDDRETIFKSVNASYEANLELLKKKLVGSPVKDSASIVIEEPSQEVAGPDAAVEEPPLGRDVTNAGREESSQEVAGPDAAGGGRPQKRARLSQEGGAELLVHLVNVEEDVNKYYRVSSKCGGKIFKSLVSQRNAGYVGFDISFVRKTMDAIRSNNSRIIADNKKKLLSCILWDVLRLALTPVLAEVFDLALELHCDVKEILSAFSYHSIRCAIYSEENDCVKFILDKVGQDLDREKMKDAILYATLLAVRGGGLNILLSLLDNVKAEEKMYFFSEIIKTTTYLHGLIYEYEELDSTKVFCHFANIITCDDRETIFKSVNASYEANLELLKKKLVGSPVKDSASIVIEEPSQEVAGPDAAVEEPPLGRDVTNAGREEPSHTPVLEEMFDLALEPNRDVEEVLSAFSYLSIRRAIYSKKNDCVKLILDKVGQDFDREKMRDAISCATLLAVHGGGLNILLSLLDNVKAEEKMYFFSEIIKTTTYLHGLIYKREELDSTKVFCHFANIITCDDRETIFKSVNASYEANLELLKKKLVRSPVKDSASIVIEEPSQEVAGPDAAVEEPPLGRDVTNAGREEPSQEVAGPDAAVEEPPLGRDVTNAGREEPSQEVAGPDAAVEEPPLGRDVTNAGREEPSQEVAGPDAAVEGLPRGGEAQLREYSPCEQRLRRLQPLLTHSFPTTRALNGLSLEQIRIRENDVGI